MTQIPADKARLLERDNTAFPAGTGRLVSTTLIAIGLIAALVTTFIIFFGPSDNPLLSKQMLASYHIGWLFALGISLGSLVFVMILQQTNAGWSATIRRQVEQFMAMMPWTAVLSLPVLLSVLIMPGKLWKWMDPSYVAGDVVYAHKEAFLNVPFFTIRFLLYFAVWLILSHKLYSYSRRQDESGDKWLTARARRMSSYGLLLFALTTAFAGIDWLMTLDYHWFSTMFGVYFFAGNMAAALGTIVLTLLILRRTGRLQGLVTIEHLHDMAKLMFGFTVFWAYIGFSQYFLIWYGNIPEETAWFVRRRSDGWMAYSIWLVIGRFILPFLILMPRPFRRNLTIVGVMAAVMVGFHILDLFWMVRPQVYGDDGPIHFNLLDIVAIAGPVLIYFGLVIRRIVSAPLAPLNDPRLRESLKHKNYV